MRTESRHARDAHHREAKARDIHTSTLELFEEKCGPDHHDAGPKKARLINCTFSAPERLTRCETLS